MSGQCPPAIRRRVARQHAERLELLAEASMLANTLLQKVERLGELEPAVKLQPMWQQAIVAARGIGSLARREADGHRRRAKRKEGR